MCGVYPKMGGISIHMCRKWKSLWRYLTSKYLSASYSNNFQLKIKSIEMCALIMFSTAAPFSPQQTAESEPQSDWCERNFALHLSQHYTTTHIHTHTQLILHSTQSAENSSLIPFLRRARFEIGCKSTAVIITTTWYTANFILKCVLQCEHINIFALYNGKINQRAHKLNLGSEILWFSKERFSLPCEITQQYHAILCRRNHLDINEVLSA